jgi:hypothetical protein
MGICGAAANKRCPGSEQGSQTQSGFNTTIASSIQSPLKRNIAVAQYTNSPHKHCNHGSLLARRRSVEPPATPARSPANAHPELINIHSAFHAGAYQQVLDFDTSNFSSSNALPVRVLKLRSQIALGQAQAVSSELASEKTPDLVAVKLLADYEQGKDVVSQAKKLAEQHGQENLVVQLCVGMILERAGETEAALDVLSKHQGSLDAYVIQTPPHGPYCGTISG